jgi:N-methylhydantoinase B
VRLAPGETILSTCCSGAGYGDPLERDVRLVATDVRERYITPGRAETVYGVVLDARGEPDADRTEQLRRGLHAAEPTTHAQERK